MNSKNSGEYIRNASLAAMAGQMGCLTAALILSALFLGIWLDAMLGTKPILTLICILGSVPFSLVIMVYMVLGATKRITPPKVNSDSSINNEGGRPL